MLGQYPVLSLFSAGMRQLATGKRKLEGLGEGNDDAA